MLNMNQFVEKLVDQIVMNGIDRELVTVKPVKKNNGRALTGIMIKPSKDSPIAPVMYADEFIGEYEDGRKSIEDIAKELVEASFRELNGKDSSISLSKEAILGGAFLQAIGADANKEMLSTVPNEKILDIAIIVRTKLSVFGIDGSTTITNQMIESYGITKEELFDAAKKNATGSFMCVPVEQLMMSISGQIDDDDIDENAESDIGDHGLYVATNRSKMFGASVIAFPELLEKYAKRLGGSVYILPSSIHEVMVLKKNPSVDPDDLHSMVIEINRTQVTPEEVLTDSVYEYDIDTKELRVA